MKRYSIVIQPSNSVIEEVKQMKELLASKIGWYNSKNSLAHITINEFELEEIELEHINSKLTKITTYLKSQEVQFTSFDVFSNGAFFLKPNVASRHYLKEIMTTVHQKFSYPTNIKSYEPHMSIGRRIQPENIEVAKSLFSKNPNISFICDTIALRCFNEERKQFHVIATFSFLGEESQDVIQGLLF
ncbi:2'-5' RNA ligase family protein [Hanstruepera ponticola]|uniref:2'-5' RNA ligase family protein n=1 Tax=Hanstruepera ponticola TaxID=2042995 RepID=UPI0017809E2C|nr:2'-5' RNA ligase family protein [Hanstruepera ponticola]